jgi:polar amino acid transport system substrate-binding protein
MQLTNGLKPGLSSNAGPFLPNKFHGIKLQGMLYLTVKANHKNHKESAMGYRIYWYTILILSIITLGYGDQKKVRIATLEDYAPFCMTVGEFKIHQTIQPGNDAVGFQGYSWDVIRQSFHEMGYTIHLSIIPWPRGMAYIKKGQIDILFPADKNTDRQRHFYYSEEPVNIVNFVIYIHADAPIEWKGLESFNGLTIGVKRGFSYGDQWDAANDINKKNVNRILQGFQMLNARRLDGFIGYEYNWDYVLNQNNLRHKYRKIPLSSASSEYPIALKKNPEGKAFLNAFDTGKKKLIKTGKLEQIKNKWFKTEFPMEDRRVAPPSGSN